MQTRTILLSLMLVLVLVSYAAVARPGGTPAGFTGAPADGKRNCTSCHSGTNNSGPGSVAIAAPSTYAPGSVVPVTVSLSNLQSSRGNGFQMAAFNATNQILSGWTSTDATTSVSSNRVNQTRNGNKSSSWLAYLTTPSSPTAFTVYTAGLDGDGTGGTSRDRAYTTSHPMAAGTVNLSMTALPQTGTTLPFVLNAPGEGGKTYVMAASFGNTGISIGGRTVPLSFDMLLLLTVQNVLPAVFQKYQGTLSAGGTASASLLIPAGPGLKGVTLHHAFVVIDASKPGGVGTVSNGLAVTLY
jgi:hypothetical protein